MASISGSDPLTDVTQEEFEAYEEVRQSGDYNMVMNGKAAARAAGLSLDRYWAVLGQYDAARKAYGKGEA